jgi:hypothetical protein
MFSALVPLIVSEDDQAGYGYARVALTLVMGVVGTLQLVTFLFSVDAATVNPRSRWLWLRPKYCEDFDAHHSVLKPVGIALFCIFGVYISNPMKIPTEINIGQAFMGFGIAFWTTFRVLVLIGYVAIRSTPVIQWVDGTVTSFEYFIVVCHVCTTLFSSFQIVAALIPEPTKIDSNAADDEKCSNDNLTPLPVIQEFFNITQFCSQVIKKSDSVVKIIVTFAVYNEFFTALLSANLVKNRFKILQILFYFWAKSVQRPSDELLNTDRRVKLSYLLRGIVISLTALNAQCSNVDCGFLCYSDSDEKITGVYLQRALGHHSQRSQPPRLVVPLQQCHAVLHHKMLRSSAAVERSHH